MPEGNRHRKSERGSALIFVIILMVTIGGLVTAHLGELNAEKRKIQVLINAQRAEDRAMGELERARNIVNASPYVNDHNTALWSAINSDPPYVPGTEVMVQKVGNATAEWYLLRATGQFQGVTKSAQIFARERSPFSSYNLFVIDHPVGLSGAPRGPIHTNKSIDFMFPFGTYLDELTAVTGFQYQAGATPDNTRIWGPANPNSAPMNDVLSAVSVPNLKDKADTLKVTDNLIARVELQGKNTKVDLYTPKTTLSVRHDGTRRVFDKLEKVKRKQLVKKYKSVKYKIRVPEFNEITEHVKLRRRVYNWREVTRSRYVPTYEDRTETYTVKEPVWATRLIPRSTLEETWVEDRSSSQHGLTMLRVIIAELRAKREELIAKKYNTELVDKELVYSGNAVNDLLKAPPAYDSAIAHCNACLVELRASRAFAAMFAPKLLPQFDHRIGQFEQAIKLIKYDKSSNGDLVAVKDDDDDDDDDDREDDDGPSLETIEGQLAAGSERNVASGFFALKAMTDYIEQPYIASTRTVTKTRIRRVRTGRKLVSYKRRIREFSHFEDRMVTRKRRIVKGYKWVERTRNVFDGWETKEVEVDVPVYRLEPYTVYEEVHIPETLVETKIVATSGTIYIEKDIAQIFGQVNGQLTMITNGEVKVTDSIVYVDDSGNRRMLNGLDPTETYEFNPAYLGNAVLLLLASGNISYTTDVPQYFEVNASMITTGGKVAMQGINVSPDGTSVSVDDDVKNNPTNYIKESIRRLGGIVARKRPVAVYVDEENNVVAGFKEGVSHMDRNLVLSDGGTVLPPNVFQLNRPMWSLRALGKHIDVQN